MTEIIELIVKVKIHYIDQNSRIEAIKKAKDCVLSKSIIGNTSVIPKSAKLI